MGEEKAHKQYRGRLAPTPSGFLHEGHVQTFRTVTDRSRANKGRIIFRMDDLDPNRCTEEYASACLEDIKGMGLEWDEGPDVGGMYGPYEQSKRAHFYFEILQKLYEKGYVYPCNKSRKEIMAYGLLNSRGTEYLFPQNFRPQSGNWKFSNDLKSTNWRFCTNWGERIEFLDIKKAEQSFHVGTDLSDFLVWRKDGVAAYELATVVDDYHMEITEIVRGEDLLLSSARQCLLFDSLGWQRPDFYHCELLLGENGKKLSKSSRDLPRLFSRS